MDDLVRSEARSTGLHKLTSESIPAEFYFGSSYPNPFNPSTQIKLDLPEASTVSLTIYDVIGRQVAELASGYHEAGYHSVTWNATNQASGVYFARFIVTDALREREIREGQQARVDEVN